MLAGVSVHPARKGEQESCRSYEADCRGNSACKARAPKCAVRNEGEHEQVRQRQPHRTKLFHPWRKRIDHTAGMVQMRFGIAVGEEPACVVSPKHGHETDRSCNGCNRGRRNRLHPSASSLMPRG